MSTVVQDNEIILCAGITIRASEVENVLRQHTAVAQCILIGIPDQAWGEALHAIVVPQPGHGINAANLLPYCRRRLTAPAWLRTLELREEPLPYNRGDKLMRHELRRVLWPKENQSQGHHFSIHVPSLNISLLAL